MKQDASLDAFGMQLWLCDLARRAWEGTCEFGRRPQNPLPFDFFLCMVPPMCIMRTCSLVNSTLQHSHTKCPAAPSAGSVDLLTQCGTGDAWRAEANLASGFDAALPSSLNPSQFPSRRECDARLTRAQRRNAACETALDHARPDEEIIPERSPTRRVKPGDVCKTWSKLTRTTKFTCSLRAIQGKSQ